MNRHNILILTRVNTELKYTQKGAAVCSFALASNRFFKQDHWTDAEGKDGDKEIEEPAADGQGHVNQAGIPGHVSSGLYPQRPAETTLSA